MKRVITVLAVLGVCLLGSLAAPVVAESVMKATEAMSSVAKDQTIDGSVYLAGETVEVAGTVQGDVYCAGQTVTVSGVVEGDVLCAGQTVTVSGLVRGDVRAAGMNVLLKGTVEGSVSLAGMNVVSDSASKIGRDASVASQQINLSGVIGRDTMLAGSTATVQGTVGRDIRGEVDKLDITQSAKVGRNVDYTSNNEATVAQGVVTGSVVRSAVQKPADTGRGSPEQLLVAALMGIMSFALVTLLITLVLPRYVHRVSDISGIKQFAFRFLVGLVTLVLTPVIIVLLCVSLVGIFAAIILGLAVLLTSLIGGSLVAYRLGRFLFTRKKSPVMNAVFGAIVLGMFSVVPFVGVLIGLVSAVTGVGMVVLGLKTQHTNPVYSADLQTAVVAPAAGKSVPKKTKNPTKKS